MRNLLVLIAAISLVLGAAGVASAAPTNWSGTTTVFIGDIPPFVFSGGGVATVNNSAGGVPAHLDTLRLKGSRGQITGTDTQFISDPDTAGNGIAAVIVEMEQGWMFVTGIRDGSLMCVVTGADADIGTIGYEIAVFADRAGDVLTPEVREELKSLMLARG